MIRKEELLMQRTMLASGVAKLLDQCLGVKKNERVVIVTDTNKRDVAEVIASVLYERKLDVSLCVMIPRNYHGQEKCQ